MKNENKVLACVDQSPFSPIVSDYAAWAARRISAPLELLHVIDHHPERGSGSDHSGAIGINSQENLLSKLTQDDETRIKAMRDQGRVFLNQLRERAIATGLTVVDVRQRHGDLESTLLEQEDEVRLIVIGRRGAGANKGTITGAGESTTELGRNLERVVRTLHKPILTVSAEFKIPQRVLFAFDGSIVTRRGVEMLAASSLFRGLVIYLLMSGKPSPQAENQLEWAKNSLETAGFEVVPLLIFGDAEKVINSTVQEQAIDLLVMGAYSHSPLRQFFVGSKTNALLKISAIPTLLLR